MADYNYNRFYANGGYSNDNSDPRSYSEDEEEYQEEEESTEEEEE